MEIESDLKVTSDRLLRTVEQLDALESEKRNVKPDSERFQFLAKEIERLAAQIFTQSQTQHRLGQRAQTLAQQTGEEVAPINEVASSRELSTILNEWRDAERRMSQSAAGSAEHAVASADVDRLRDEYQSTFLAGSQDKSS